MTRATTMASLFLAVLSMGASCEPTSATTPPPSIPEPAAFVGRPGIVHRLALGVNHGCGVASNGTVWCWGANGHGELGDGTTTPATTPVLVTGLQAVTEVAAGDTHTCALHGDGSVACWGYNLYGQSGDGTLPAEGAPESDRRTAATVPGLSRVVSLTAGVHTFCARIADGTVSCWGNGDTFLVGARAAQKIARPLRVEGLRGVLDMSAFTQACARVTPEPAETWCWGMGRAERPTPRRGTAGARQVSVGSAHACVLDAAGKVACWGPNGSGELGLPGVAEIGDSDALRPVAGLTEVRQIAAGRNATCALRADGKVSCWGALWGLGHTPPSTLTTHNSSGGGGSAAQWEYVAQPVEVPGVEGIEELAGGYFQMCGRRGDEVVCWDTSVSTPMRLGRGDP